MWKKQLLRYLLPTLFFILVCAFQTTLWPNFLGAMAPPPFWLVVMIWLSLYRPELPTVLFLYFLGILASSFSAIPLKMMLFPILLLHGGLTLIRDRIYRQNSGYFMLTSVGAVAFYQLIYFLLSRILEPIPTAFLPWDRFVQLSLTAPSALLVHSVMGFLERPFASELVDSEEASS